MDSRKRILVNTTAQYTKAFINICLSLYTVPIILDALGENDYGVYSLIAGIVAMLAFVTNAMVVTTQRHISFYIGQDNDHSTRKIFSNSVLMHIAIGLLLALIIIPCRDIFIPNLNIEECRKPVAAIVYHMSVTMIFISFITAPFKAALIAHENIVFISVVEVMDGLIKLVMTLMLLNMDVDKLLIYSYMMTSVFAFEFVIYLIYSITRYKECKPRMFLHDYDISYLKELGGFAGWTTFGMGAVIGRTQGMSVLFNQFFGTTANAAYGIATHFYSYVSFISTSVVNAMNPQIMQAEGRKDRLRMLNLAEQESKILFILMSVAFIPLIIEMDGILSIWLQHKVPEGTCIMCQCLLAAFIADQSTYGLLSANQATGKIKWFTIIMYTPKLLFIALVWLMFVNHHSIEEVMFAFIGIETVMAFARLPYMKYTAKLSIVHFVRHVFFRETILIAVLIIAGLLLRQYIHFPFSFLLTIPLNLSIGSLTIWTVVLTKEERIAMMQLIKDKVSK